MRTPPHTDEGNTMSLFKGLSDLTKLIGSSVGNNLDNEEEDVRTIRNSFKEIDFPRDDEHETDENNEPLGFITRGLDNKIKNFQRKNDLREDGYITPGGETEKTLTQELKKKHVTIFENGELEKKEEEEIALNPFTLTRGGLSVNKDKIAEGLGKILLTEADETPTPKRKPETEKEKEKKDRDKEIEMNSDHNKRCIDLHQEHREFSDKISTSIPNEIRMLKTDIEDYKKELIEWKKQLSLAAISPTSPTKGKSKFSKLGKIADAFEIKDKSTQIQKIINRIDQIKVNITSKEQQNLKKKKEFSEVYKKLIDNEKRIKLLCPNE